MKIWLSKNSEVPVREQLVTQITIGVLSGDLQVGDKLPSTREIARRFQIHSNTVSSAYQKLAHDGWLEFKKGSGFYVRQADDSILNIEMRLDRLITDLLWSAQSLGFSPADVHSRLVNRVRARPAKRVFVIESDRELRDIVVSEIAAATGANVAGIDLGTFAGGHKNDNTFFTAMIDEKPKLDAIVPSDRSCVYLRANSVADAMAGQQRPAETDLIAVASGWKKFLWMAKTMLVAANLEPASLIIRHTNEKGWKKGLGAASMIICDSLTASALPESEKVRPFRIISADSLGEIKHALES